MYWSAHAEKQWQNTPLSSVTNFFCNSSRQCVYKETLPFANQRAFSLSQGGRAVSLGAAGQDNVWSAVCMPWVQNQDRREAKTQHGWGLPHVLWILYLFDIELIWLLNIHKCLPLYKLSRHPPIFSQWLDVEFFPQSQKLCSNWLEILGLSVQAVTLPLNDIPEIEEIKSFWTDSDVLYLNVFDFDGIVGS